MKSIFAIITLLISFIVPSVSSGLLPDNTHTNTVTYQDISYSDAERNVMDIYLPEKSSDRSSYGALMFIHGGSWTSGDKSSEAYLCKKYQEKGYVTASINYHYIDNENTISTNMDDITSAIQKLKEFCNENGYNVTNLALHGFSSGAHLATLFSYSCPERSAIPLSFVINMVGPADFNSDTWQEWDYDKNTGPGLALLLYGIKNLDNGIADLTNEKQQEIINTVSPIYYINENSIPTICGYAGDGKDGIVPTKNKTLTFEKLKKHNVKNDCCTFENSNHLLMGDMAVREALYNKVDEYCTTYFGY